MERRTAIQLILFGLLYVPNYISCSEEFSPFEREGLAKHNEYRQMHGVPPLKLSREICDWAKEWADHMAKEDIFDHRPNNKYGENLYFRKNSKGPSAPSPTKATTSWYSEIKDYNFSNPGYDDKTCHFTTLIWKNTVRFGIASAVNYTSKFEYVVANYDPWPNRKGEFSSNVFPPLSNFELEAVNLHNDYRERHHAPPLTINREMCDMAQKWADHLADKEVLVTSQDKYGQNLFAFKSSDQISDAKATLEYWYKSKDFYNFDNPVYSKEAGSFTSLIWVGAKELGIAKSTDLVSGKTVVVAYYDPPTNVDGKFETNVLPISTSTSTSSVTSSHIFTSIFQLIFVLLLSK